MNGAEELELIHPDHHDTLKTMVSMASRELHLQESNLNHNDTYTTHRTVDVIFHAFTGKEAIKRKLVRMELSPHDAYEKVSNMAKSLFPGCKSKIFSGNENHVNAEFTNSRQVWDAIQRGIYYHFDYLHVRHIEYGEHEADELKFVPPEFHDLAMGKFDPTDLPILGHSHVYATFHVYGDRKLERVSYVPPHGFESISRNVCRLFPESKWKMFSGNEYRIDFEITDTKQFYKAMKTSPIYKFEYLEVRLIKVGETAHCDGCDKTISGNRYKCTFCIDFDLCFDCVEKGFHHQHELLKIEPV